MNRYVHQIPFAAQGAFVWNRATVHNGQPVKAGDPVNNEAFTSVRLRQMYDARMIVPAPGFADSPKPAYLENGRGKADQLRKEIEREEGEGKDAASVPTAKSGADAKKSAAAASPAAAKTVGSKPAAKPSKSPRARRAA